MSAPGGQGAFCPLRGGAAPPTSPPVPPDFPLFFPYGGGCPLRGVKCPHPGGGGRCGGAHACPTAGRHSHLYFTHAQPEEHLHTHTPTHPRPAYVRRASSHVTTSTPSPWACCIHTHTHTHMRTHTQHTPAHTAIIGVCAVSNCPLSPSHPPQSPLLFFLSF